MAAWTADDAAMVDTDLFTQQAALKFAPDRIVGDIRLLPTTVRFEADKNE